MASLQRAMGVNRNARTVLTRVANTAGEKIRLTPLGLTVAILLPLAALALQWMLWPWIRPLVWFFFFPAVFLSGRFGGLSGGLLSTIVSLVIVRYFFISPRFSFHIDNPNHYLSMLLFLAMGWLLSDSQERLIQARERIADALQQTQVSARAAFNTVMQTSQNAMLMVAQDGRIAQANPQAERMFAYATAAMVGMTLEDLTPERFRGRHRQEWAAYAADPQPRLIAPSTDLFARRSDGGEFPVEVSVGPISIEGVPYVIATIADISARRQAEAERKKNTDMLAAQMEALRKSEEHFRLLLEGVRDCALYMLDPAGRVTTWNGGAELIKGYSAEEIIGQHFACFYLREDIECSRPQEELRKAAAEGHCVAEGWRMRKDGSRFWADIRITALRDEAGTLRGFANVTRDITERRKAEMDIRTLNVSLEQKVARRTADLLTANQDLEAFSYSVSHDLRAPLRSIDGFSQALQEDHAAEFDEEGRDYVARIRRSAQHMGTLIDDLLNLSRIARNDLMRKDVDLSTLAHTIADTLQASAPERKVEFHIADQVKVSGDPRLLRIALENLLNNAWKFTARKSLARIEFGQKQVDGQPACYVADNGVGFDMAYAGKLFGAFQRLHNTRDFAGTGIGLATVQRIINKHGGRIWVEAQHAKGATFYFKL